MPKEGTIDRQGPWGPSRVCHPIFEGTAIFLEKRISFYLDGTGWVHKVNPSSHAVTSRTRTWRKSSEGLHPHCTAKGKKEGVGGRVARFMVAISHGNGVIDAIPYEGSIDGKKFANIVKKNFPSLFQKSGSNSTIFLQDGDSSQNSAVARKAIEDKGYWIFHIPARSPDLNPIENVFHLAGKDIREQGRAIFKESYEEFVRRCRQTLLQFPADVIDRTISSIPKRLQAVVQSGGQRTKYWYDFLMKYSTVIDVEKMDAVLQYTMSSMSKSLLELVRRGG